MDSIQYKAVKNLFLDAIEIEHDLINDFLIESCNDPQVLKEVDRLLKTYFSHKKNTKHFEKQVSQTIVQSTLFFPNERYVLIRQIGDGGMGRVYLAQRNVENIVQNVAIKVLQLNDQISRQRFFQETKILSQLSHPNISQFIDADFLQDGRPYVVMEYIEGETITQHCCSLELNEKIELFLQLCLAVKHAHRNLIIHQDIKPDNVLVNDNKQVKLLDFGISKIVSDSPKQTQTMLRAMTPEYASPEQLLSKYISVSSDIYSLGIVFYELLSGKLPFKIEGLSPIELEKLLSANPNLKPSKQLSLLVVNKNKHKVDDDLDNIALMALDFDTNERYQSVDELIDDLILYQNNKPIKAGKKGTVYKVKKFFIRNKLTLLTFFILFMFALTFVLTLIEKNSAIENQLDTISKQRDDLQLEQIRAENIASTFTDDRYADFDNNGKQETVINHNINIGNGNLFHAEEMDLLGSPIKFSVYYNSKSAIQTRGRLPTNLIGKGWTHSYSRNLSVGNDSMTYAVAYRPDGSSILFEKDNKWRNNKKSKEELLKQGGRWIFINELGENEIYDRWGKLLEIQTKKLKMNFEWEQITISNNSSNLTSSLYKNRLSKISTNDGHFLEFNYKHGSTSVIESFNDEIGRTWEFGYDLFYNLITIKNPNGTGKAYRYEKEHLPHAITSVGTILYEGFSIFPSDYDYDDSKNRLIKVRYKSTVCENETISIDYCCGKRTLTNSKGMVNEYEVINNNGHWNLLKSNLSYDYSTCDSDKIDLLRN